MKDKCQHYSGVDKGFYCWKCLEQQRNQIISEIKEELNKYKCGKHKRLYVLLEKLKEAKE